MKIVITGMRGVGKSVVGKLLSEKLKLTWVDIDTVVEVNVGMSVSSLVEKKGWDAFRSAELQAVEQLSGQTNLVISTGGGTVCHFDNAKKLKDNGIVILLTAPTPVLVSRIGNEAGRPSLTDASVTDELQQIWEERRPQYEQVADYIIDVENQTPTQVVEKILDKLKSQE